MANGRPCPTKTEVSDRAPVEYVEGEALVRMVQADLLTRRISIEICRDIIQYLRDQDAQTRHRLENILAIKGQRASDAANRAARIAAYKEKTNMNMIRAPEVWSC